MESLTSIMNRNGSDKGSGHHNYTDFYEMFFAHLREREINLLEIGIGTVNPRIPSSMCGTPGGYTPGSSLRGWRDYFSKANIYGCDIDRDILFTDSRISTFYLDQTNPEVIKTAICDKNITYDIIIDDGLHHFATNWKVLKQILCKVNPGGIYIIEDILDFDPKIMEETFVKQEEKNGLSFRYINIPNPKNTVDNNIFICVKPLSENAPMRDANLPKNAV